MAQITSGMIANAIDNESMVILAQPTSSALTPSEFNTALENTVVNSLAAHIPASVITLASSSTNPVIAAIANNFTITPLSEEERTSFDIQTTTDVSDISFALISQYDDTIVESLDNDNSNIGTPNNPIYVYNSIIAPSASIYDSNVAFNYEYNGLICPSTSNNENVAYPTDLAGTIPDQGTWEATFDAENSNVNYSRALNSEYNTKNYSRPMSVEEYTTFNKTYALGMDLTSSNVQHYFTLDSNGKPTENIMDMESSGSEQGYTEPYFILNWNGYVQQKSSEFNNISLDDCGSYRVQQYPDIPLITISEDDVVNDSTSQSNISNFPIFNANANPDQALLTNTISLDTFYSIFNRDYSTEGAETIVPGYKYSVTINESLNSGYSPNADMVARQDNANIFSLDDSELLDNANYMEHYVNGLHTLSFDDAGLTINADCSSSSDNIVNVFSLNTEREYITEENFANGEIRVNNNTPTTRTSVDENSLEIDTNVYYNGENANYGSISSELEQNASVTYLSQLVAKNSKDIDGSFMKNTGNLAGNFALDLFYNDAIVNSNFNVSDFGFTVPNPRDVQAEVFRINSLKQLASINGFNMLTEGVGTKVDGVSTFANLRNMKTLFINNNNVYDKSKMVFTLKDLEGSSIYNATNGTGWSVSSENGAKLVSSSSVAYSSDSMSFPGLANSIALIKNEIETINYKISINTAITGSSGNLTSSSHLGDYAKIEWSSDNFETNANSIVFSQDMLTRVQTPVSVSPLDETTKVNLPFILSGKLNGKRIEVFNVTSIRNIVYSFDFPLRPFTGLSLTSPSVTVTTNSYIVKDSVTGELYPKSYLKYVTDSLSTDYSHVTESLSSTPVVQGTLTSNDLCDMMVTVFKQDTDNEMDAVAITANEHISSMYGIEKIIELYESQEQESLVGDISVSIECEYLNSEGSETNIIFDNIEGYQLQFTSSYNTNYTCDYWSADMENITSSTSIGSVSDTQDYSNKIINIDNGYSAITQWNIHDYEAVVSYEGEDNSTVVLSIREKESSVSLYEIRTNNFTYLNSTVFISHIPLDIFRNVRWIGQKGSDDSLYFSEQFIQVDYSYTNSDENTQPYIFSIDAGVYLTSSTLTSTTYSKADIGSLIKFSLLSDLIGVNMISSVNSLNPIEYNQADVVSTEANHFITNYGFTFQYVDDDSNSRKLSINRYRGFYGSGVQIFSIVRDVMVATLTIYKSCNDEECPETISQSWNVYQNKEYTVDNLSGSVGGIGLKLSFLLSMLAVEGDEIVADERSFTIYTQGDSVSFAVENPNVGYTEMSPYYRPAQEPVSLKTFVLDTFTGSNFNEQESPLSINSYRLKVRTQNSSNPLNKASVSWSVQLNFGPVCAYKNPCYLGLPANLDTNDAYAEPDSELWEKITPEVAPTFLDLITDGLTIAKWTLKREILNYNPSISYFVIIPPYLKFTQVESDMKNLPYDFDSETDLRTIYVPVVETIEGLNIYTPFQQSINYPYIATTDEVSSVNVSCDQTLLNNVCFVQTAAEEFLANYTDIERNNVPLYSFVVEGNMLTMRLVVGIKEQSGNTIGQMFGPLPANRLMYLDNEDVYFHVKNLVNFNSGITMHLLQPTDILSTPYNLSTSQVFSTQSEIKANITFEIDNFFSKNTFALDLPTGEGTKVALYTREMLNSGNDFTIYVYKYNAINNFDYNDVNNNGTSNTNKQAASLTYLQRSYKTLTIEFGGFRTHLQNLSSEDRASGKSAFEEYVKSHAQELVLDINEQEWILDESWPNEDEGDMYNAVYTSLVCYNTDAMKNIPPKVFSTTFDGKAKAFYVSKHPVLSMQNKLGLTTAQITSWGTLVTSGVSVANITFNTTTNTAPFGNISNLVNSTPAGFRKGNIGA